MKNKENSVKDKAIKQARTLLRNKEKAVLSTHSASKDGYPFGSVSFNGPLRYIVYGEAVDLKTQDTVTKT